MKTEGVYNSRNVVYFFDSESDCYLKTFLSPTYDSVQGTFANLLTHFPTIIFKIKVIKVYFQSIFLEILKCICKVAQKSDKEVNTFYKELDIKQQKLFQLLFERCKKYYFNYVLTAFSIEIRLKFNQFKRGIDFFITVLGKH